MALKFANEWQEKFANEWQEKFANEWQEKFLKSPRYSEFYKVNILWH